MPGTVLVAYLAGLVPALLLLVAGVTHLASPRALAADLRRQRLVPPAAIPGVARLLPLVDVGVALAVGGALGGWRPLDGSALPHAAAVLVYLAFAGYATVLLRRSDHDRVPCGCSPTGTSVTALVPLRAGALAGLALFALATTPSVRSFAGHELAVAWLAAMTFTILLWTAPSALSSGNPRPTTREHSDVIHG